MTLTLPLVLLLVLGSSATVQRPLRSLLQDTNETELWSAFKQRFGKFYGEDEEMRFGIFLNNLQTVERMNQLEGHSVFGVTRFSDLTEEEFRLDYLSGYKKVTRANPPVLSAVPRSGVPTSWNWATKGATTPVYNQGQCGSCWAFSATEQIESMAWLSNSSQAIRQLSMQQIVDCDHGQDEGCNGGDTTTAYQYVMKQGGLDWLKDYPYTAEDGTCAFASSELAAGVLSWSYVIPQNSTDENKMMNYVGTTAPISICVDAASWQFYFGGVISHLCGNNLDHCVQITGYATDDGIFGKKPYWIIRNSWGQSWEKLALFMLSAIRTSVGLLMNPRQLSLSS